MDKQFLGFDAGVYVLVGIIGVLLFFFWRWIFRKIKPVARRRILIWLVTILTAPMVYMLLVLIVVFASEYYPNRDFDQKKWQDDKDERYEYTHDLIKRKLLLGKTKNQVLKLLGNDADTSQINELGYDIGFRPELTGIDPSYLIINFKDGKADTVIEHDR